MEESISSIKSGWLSWMAETFTEKKKSLFRSRIFMKPASTRAAAVFRVSRRTRVPSGTMSPEDSASGMKRSGPMGPNSGCLHRARTSQPAGFPSIWTMGWKARVMPPEDRARRRSPSRRFCVVYCSRMSSANTTLLFFPATLAVYIAMSASRRHSSGLE